MIVGGECRMEGGTVIGGATGVLETRSVTVAGDGISDEIVGRYQDMMIRFIWEFIHFLEL